MVIQGYNIQDFPNLSGKDTSVGVKRLEQTFSAIADIHLPHRHNYYEIIWVTQGEGINFIDFNQYPITPNSLHFVSPGQVHAWELAEDVTGYAVIFTHEFFSMGLQDKYTLSELPLFYSVNTDTVVHVNEQQAVRFNDLFERIEREYQASLIDRDDMLRAYLRILLIEAKRLCSPTEITENTKSGVFLTKKFLLLIEEYFLTKTSVTDYAKLLNVTANHLNETVKRTAGKTAGELIRDRLLLEAKRLLIYSEMTVSEIAYYLDFKDPSYFGKFFRKYTGHSPGIFRMQVGTGTHYPKTLKP